jgi:hypothetical protein
MPTACSKHIPFQLVSSVTKIHINDFHRTTPKVNHPQPGYTPRLHMLSNRLPLPTQKHDSISLGIINTAITCTRAVQRVSSGGLLKNIYTVKPV